MWHSRHKRKGRETRHGYVAYANGHRSEDLLFDAMEFYRQSWPEFLHEVERACNRMNGLGVDVGFRIDVGKVYADVKSSDRAIRDAMAKAAASGIDLIVPMLLIRPDWPKQTVFAHTVSFITARRGELIARQQPIPIDLGADSLVL